MWGFYVDKTLDIILKKRFKKSYTKYIQPVLYKNRGKSMSQIRIIGSFNGNLKIPDQLIPVILNGYKKEEIVFKIIPSDNLPGYVFGFYHAFSNTEGCENDIITTFLPENEIPENTDPEHLPQLLFEKGLFRVITSLRETALET